VVVGEHDSTRIELLETVHPGRYRRQRLGMAVAASPPGEGVGAEPSGGVMHLTSHDDGSVATPHDERLMAHGMAGRREHEHTWQQLRLAVEDLVTQARRIYESGQGVVRGAAGGIKFDALDEDRSSPEPGIAPAMVEVQVAVDHQLDILHSCPSGGQRRPQWPASRTVVGVDLGMNAHSGVHQHEPVRVFDEVAEARIHSWGTRVGLLTRPDEVPEVDPPNRDVAHREKYVGLRK